MRRHRRQHLGGPPTHWVFPFTVWLCTAWALVSFASAQPRRVATAATTNRDVSRFDRVLVAGFVTRTTEPVDLNRETVRLLRTHLGSHTSLTVVDAAPLYLGDFSETKLEESGKLFELEKLLSNEAYWRQLGEKYRKPLIITGSLALTSGRRITSLSRVSGGSDPAAHQRFVIGARAIEGSGFVLSAELCFIDGRSGEILRRERFSEEVVYWKKKGISSRDALFELVDRIRWCLSVILSKRHFS